MSDLNKKDIPEDSADDSIGLDNESILARRKVAEDPTARQHNQRQMPRQQRRVQSAQPTSAVQRPHEPAARPVQRQTVRQTAQGSAPARQARPVSQSGAPAGQKAANPAAAQRPVSRPVVSMSAPQPKRQGAAVVPAAKREIAAKEPKSSAPAPAYAARRSVTPAVQPVSDNPGGTKKSSAFVSVDAPADKSKKGSTKAGADMMVSIVKGIIYMVLVLVVSVFISVFVIRIGNDVFAFVKSDEQIDISIPDDATTADIADILYDNGIIKYPSIFKLYASIKHEKGDYLGGTYTISPSLSYDKLRSKFKKQIETGTCWVTIPEGYTTDEIIDLMVENGIGERETYIDVINNYDFDYWFVDELKTNGVPESRAYRLDGYLFPDSYQFYKASSEVTVINKLLARFNEVFVEDYRTRASELGYTADQVLTIASMVEKEAGRAADFMNVSSVFHNRLNDPYNYARLQSDATTVYAIQVATGQRPKDITPEDNNYDSPYNTYLYEGLPPGPITNPSASAIRYALYPANTSYKYFVSANNGTTLFASGKAEHDANIEIVRQMNAD